MITTIISLFLIGLIIGIGVLLPQFLYEVYKERKQKKQVDSSEMQEAARMFEERIALKPKHMSSRHASGAAPVIFGEFNENKD